MAFPAQLYDVTKITQDERGWLIIILNKHLIEMQKLKKKSNRLPSLSGLINLLSDNYVD